MPKYEVCKKKFKVLKQIKISILLGAIKTLVPKIKRIFTFSGLFSNSWKSYNIIFQFQLNEEHTFIRIFQQNFNKCS